MKKQKTQLTLGGPIVPPIYAKASVLLPATAISQSDYSPIPIHAMVTLL